MFIPKKESTRVWKPLYGWKVCRVVGGKLVSQYDVVDRSDIGPKGHGTLVVYEEGQRKEAIRGSLGYFCSRSIGALLPHMFVPENVEQRIVQVRVRRGGSIRWSHDMEYFSAVSLDVLESFPVQSFRYKVCTNLYWNRGGTLVATRESPFFRERAWVSCTTLERVDDCTLKAPYIIEEGL